MRSSRFHLRSFFSTVAIFAGLALAGCGNTCVVGFSINGNGGVIVKAGDPPPVCSLAQAKGAITAIVAKSPRCESCSSSASVEHLFVTVQSIQLRPSVSAGPNSEGWFELTSNLEREPRQIDLIGESVPVILTDASIVPAEAYRDLRIQFFSGSLSNVKTLPAQNVCGDKGWNCVIFGDGRVEPLRFSGDAPELAIPFSGAAREALQVLPDDRLELRLTVEVQPTIHFSGTEGWTTQSTLHGHAETRRKSFLPENSAEAVQ